MQHKRLNNISELIEKTDTYVGERINYLNQNNSNLYTILLDGQKQLNNSIKKLSSISDMLLDIQLLKSISKNKINASRNENVRKLPTTFFLENGFSRKHAS